MQFNVTPIRLLVLALGLALVAAGVGAAGRAAASKPARAGHPAQPGPAPQAVCPAAPSCTRACDLAARVAVAPALSAPPTRARAARAPRPIVAAAAASAGMKAYLDPETGKLGPPPAGGSPDETLMLNDSGDGLVQEVLPDGSVMMNLQGRFQEYMILQLDPAGRRVLRCTQTPYPLLKSGAASLPQPVER